jgi:hypothetical protein
VEIPFQESKQVNINEQQYERIAAFLAGELSAQEQAELFCLGGGFAGKPTVV